MPDTGARTRDLPAWLPPAAQNASLPDCSRAMSSTLRTIVLRRIACSPVPGRSAAGPDRRAVLRATWTRQPENAGQWGSQCHVRQCGQNVRAGRSSRMTRSLCPPLRRSEFVPANPATTTSSSIRQRRCCSSAAATARTPLIARRAPQHEHTLSPSSRPSWRVNSFRPVIRCLRGGPLGLAQCIAVCLSAMATDGRRRRNEHGNSTLELIAQKAGHRGQHTFRGSSSWRDSPRVQTVPPVRWHAAPASAPLPQRIGELTDGKCDRKASPQKSAMQISFHRKRGTAVAHKESRIARH